MKKAQQEMIGFVLIVVLVLIALMIFVVIQVRKPAQEVESADLDNLISAMMDYTTGCAIVFEPDYSDLEELIGNCYDNYRCSNLGKSACDYLNESIVEISRDVFESDATISAYQVEIYTKDESIFKIFEGECEGDLRGSQSVIAKGSEKIYFKISVCY